MFIQQGDVLIKTVSAIPNGAVPIRRENGKIVLQRGEHTGHAHVIVDEPATMYRIGELTFVVVDAPARVEHEEHGALILAPGIYQIIRKREYDHFAEEARVVKD